MSMETDGNHTHNMAANPNGQTAGFSFIISAISLVILTQILSIAQSLILATIALLCLSLCSIYSQLARVATISFSLGLVFGLGLLLSYHSEEMRYLGVYIMILTFFHISEYLMTSVFNPHTLSLDSFLINHSREYAIAAIASWFEFALEYYFCPWLKLLRPISIIGLVLSLSGEGLRKAAMFNAGANFTHNIQYYKRPEHVLVTSGIYGYFRHPSYVGWFYWSIGTQLVLCNPLCALGYALASWHFFSDRIESEEELLIHFFGQDYVDYQNRVSIGIPFIKGFRISK